MPNPSTDGKDAPGQPAVIDVRSDLTQRAVVHAANLTWSPSPWIPGIKRKFLDRYGNGVAVPSTSVVCFESGMRDAYHTHPNGEEFYVLSGVFTDHTGDYLPGFYSRHPVAWCHATYVDPRNENVVVFVKVSQQADPNEPIVVKDTEDLDLPEWEDAECAKGRIRRLPLFGNERTGERVWIELWEPGTSAVVRQPKGGEEVFVVAGELAEDGVEHPTQTWIRNPTDGEGTRWSRSSPRGCKLFMKSGHLPMVETLYARAFEGAEFSMSTLQYRQDQRIHGDLHGLELKRRQKAAAKTNASSASRAVSIRRCIPIANLNPERR
jgi:hypothetical protein